MTNFIFVYYNNGDMGDKPIDEIKAAWGAWFKDLGDSLVDGGNPFNDNGMALESNGNVSAIENSPATGYSIVKADSMDDAVELAKGCPMLKDSKEGALRVYETMPM